MVQIFRLCLRETVFNSHIFLGTVELLAEAADVVHVGRVQNVFLASQKTVNFLHNKYIIRRSRLIPESLDHVLEHTGKRLGLHHLFERVVLRRVFPSEQARHEARRQIGLSHLKLKY